jgi:hypothetical protein
MQCAMRYAWLGCLLFGALACAGSQDSEFNVNTRYTVETVVVSGEGWTANFATGQDQNDKISRSLGKEISAQIGEKLNPGALEDIAKRLRREFHARTVERHVLRGTSPDYVQVVFEVKLRPSRFEITAPKFVYNSKQGWTGAVEGTATVRQNGFTFGLVSDGNELAERYAGLVARYENARVGTDKVHFRFAFESYHDQWNQNTLDELPAGPIASPSPALDETSGIYRTRQNFQPEMTFVLARPLTLSVGTSFERLEIQYPADHIEAANAVIASLRYHEQLEDRDNQHNLDASYSLRAATRVLDSDYAYSRHAWKFRYMLTRGKNVLLDDFRLGMVVGRAPLFERFYLGNSNTLRGWNKYDLDPLGGNRMVHNTVEYRYGVFEAFYDTGAIWDRGDAAVPRHSVGIGLRQGLFSLAVAFPLRDGRIDPIFMVGMNY